MTVRPCASTQANEATGGRGVLGARRRIVGKLASTAGDTLIEVLTALLVTVMAVTLMATMIVAATNVTSKNETRMAELFAAQSLLSEQDGSSLPDTGIVTIEGNASGYSETFKGNFYREDGFVRYEPNLNKGSYL